MIAVMKRFMQKGLGRQMITITDPLGRTQPRWDHCLTPEFYKSILPEERFRVAESNLLLDESNPTAGDKDVLGFLFIRPISHDQMQDWLQESKPWLSGAFHSPPTLSAEDTDERHRAAECLGGSMLGWLSNSEYDEFYHTAGTPPPRTVGIMEGKTKFSWSPKHFGFQSPPQENIINGTWFSTEWILDYDDGRYPHSVAYMASNLPLNEKYLLAGEVLTIFHLTFHRFVCNLAKANPVVPITLISASNHDRRSPSSTRYERSPAPSDRYADSQRGTYHDQQRLSASPRHDRSPSSDARDSGSQRGGYEHERKTSHSSRHDRSPAPPVQRYADPSCQSQSQSQSLHPASAQ
ncbi:hypothetical protein RB598_006330 [Gaeumannomyces tritici]